MKPVTDFYLHGQNGPGRRRPECKSCTLARSKAQYRKNPDVTRARGKRWAAEHPEKMREFTRKSRSRFAPGGYKHRMPIEEWEARWAAQEGNCYLCGRPLEDAIKIGIDHDHRCCGPYRSCAACRRGLVCIQCNSIVGLAGEDPDRLRRVADALEEAQAAVDIALKEYGPGADERAVPYTPEQRLASRRESVRKWHHENRDKVNAGKRARYAANREQILERRRGYRQRSEAAREA